MLVDLVPSFLAALAAPDPIEGYYRYFQEHRPILDAYWRNYIIDPDSPQAEDIIRRTVRAQRRDLHELLDHVNVAGLARDTMERSEDRFEIDRDTDVYLMVGVGGANAGELVVGGRGSAFICLEHFTGRPNAETFGLGLRPDLIPLWIAHELAHTVRYTSPRSRSPIARLVFEARGYYDYWQAGSDTPLAELLVNEGLAVTASRDVCPGFDTREYLGYGSRQYRRMRELEAFLRRRIDEHLDQTGIGHRLRYLAGGVSAAARTLEGKVVPERAGYYLGMRMVEPFVERHGVAEALRAATADILALEQQQIDSSDIQTA